MVRAKRPLEEADPNAHTNPPKSRKGNDNKRRSLRSSGPVSDIENARVAKEKDPRAVKTSSYNKSAKKNSPSSAKKATKISTSTSNKDEATASNETSTSTKKNSTPSKDKTTPAKESGNAPTSKPNSTPVKASKSAAKGKPESGTSSKPNNSVESEKNQSKDESTVDWDNTPVDKLPSYEYVVGQPPAWDWDDHTRGDGNFTQNESDDAYDKVLADLKPFLFKPLNRKPEHKWPIMHGAMVRYVDAIYDSNKRDPELVGMYIYNDFQGYGLHEVVENILLDYRKEFVKKEANRNINELWVIITGFIYYAKMHGPMTDLFGHIDDGDRVFSILNLIGVAFLSMLDTLEKAGQLKVDSDFKDLALVMKMYIIWGEEWDAMTFNDTTQQWDAKVLKYAQDHDIELNDNPPTSAEDTVFQIEERVIKESKKEKGWPKPGSDRWGFKKAFDKHATEYGKGGHNFDITKMSKAERISYSFDKKDPFADIPAKELREGKIVIGTL